MAQEQLLVNINGLAHVILTVAKYDKSHQFYTKLLPAFGMTLVHDGPDFFYHVGARTALGIKNCDPEIQKEQFQQYRVGPHLCFSARPREDVDTTAKLLIGFGAKIIRGPKVRECAPRYYYVLFEDPDGIRLEEKFVPGTGLLENGANFGSEEEFFRVDGEDLTA